MFKAQSAMEYLMTYGWAILIIAVVLGVLYQLNVFNPTTFAPKAPSGSCQVFRPDGPGTTSFINAVGPACGGEIPQLVINFPNTSVHGVVVPESPSLDTAWDGGSWTINTWFIDNHPPQTGTARDLIEESTGGTSGMWLWSGNAASYYLNTVQWYTISGTNWGAIALDSSPIPYNKWVMGTSSFYYNGAGGGYVEICVDAQCKNVTWSSNSPVDYASLGYSFLINDNDCCDGWLIGGQLANVQLYNAALSANEIQALYQEGIGGAPIDLQNLVGWWPLNGNANDYSGDGNNGQMNGVATFTSSWEFGYTAP